MAALVGTNIFGEPAFQPPSLVVIGAAAFFLIIVSAFKAIYVKIPDIAADLVKTADEFFEFRHVSCILLIYSVLSLLFLA